MKTTKDLHELIPAICEHILETVDFGYDRFNPNHEEIIFQGEDEDWWIVFNIEAWERAGEPRIAILGNRAEAHCTAEDDETSFGNRESEEFFTALEKYFNS